MKTASALRELVNAIVAGDDAGVSQMLAASPELAKASFEVGATRQAVPGYYIELLGRYIYSGDTPLHFAAAAYRAEIVRRLIGMGVDVHARNRMGNQALHSAAKSQPGSRESKALAQVATIAALIETGADPNAVDKRGVTPLHIAVRTRCAGAVRVLLERGADPMRKNKSGSTPMLLAKLTTGASGSGSREAKEQQREILRLLEECCVDKPRSK